MFRTLSELRNSVQALIDSQGEEAPCYAIIMTKHDVNDNDGKSLGEEAAERVFEDLNESGYLYQEFCDIIDESIRTLKLNGI